MGQSTYLEENFVTNLKSSTKMAPKDFRLYHSPCRNLFPLDSMEDELARDPSSVRSSHSSSTSLALSCNPTLGPVLILAPVPAPALPSSNKLFKQFMKAYLELNQGPK